jgi:hypothetical protein
MQTNPWVKNTDETVLNQEETSRRVCEESITILPQDALNPVEKSFFRLVSLFYTLVYDNLLMTGSRL